MGPGNQAEHLQRTRLDPLWVMCEMALLQATQKPAPREIIAMVRPVASAKVAEPVPVAQSVPDASSGEQLSTSLCQLDSWPASTNFLLGEVSPSTTPASVLFPLPH